MGLTNRTVAYSPNSVAPLLGLKQIFLIYSVELLQATQALREPFEFVLSKNTFWNKHNVFLILPF